MFLSDNVICIIQIQNYEISIATTFLQPPSSCTEATYKLRGKAEQINLIWKMINVNPCPPSLIVFHIP